MKQKKIQNGRLKIQNGRLQKTSFSSSANSQYFSWNLHRLVPGLVELNDAKGIGMAQLLYFCFVLKKISSPFIRGIIFLHYGLFLQNLGKDAVRTNMHTTVTTSHSMLRQDLKNKPSEIANSKHCDTWTHWLKKYKLRLKMAQRECPILITYMVWLEWLPRWIHHWKGGWPLIERFFLQQIFYSVFDCSNWVHCCYCHMAVWIGAE